MELDRAERLLAGKTLRELDELFRSAQDDRDGALVYTIEQQQKRGWRDVKLAETPDNASVMRTIKAAIETRGAARIKAKHPELIEAQTRIERLRKSAVLDRHVRHFKSGRGLAAVR